MWIIVSINEEILGHQCQIQVYAFLTRKTRYMKHATATCTPSVCVSRSRRCKIPCHRQFHLLSHRRPAVTTRPSLTCLADFSAIHDHLHTSADSSNTQNGRATNKLFKVCFIQLSRVSKTGPLQTNEGQPKQDSTGWMPFLPLSEKWQSAEKISIHWQEPWKITVWTYPILIHQLDSETRDTTCIKPTFQCQHTGSK